MTQEEINNALDEVLRFGGTEVHKLIVHLLMQVGILTPDANDTSTDATVASRRKSN